MVRFARLGIVLALTPLAGGIAIAQPGVEDKAFTIEVGVTGDFVRNFRGGLKQDMNYLGMESMILRFDTEAAGWWKGGTLVMHGINTHGGTPGSTLTGDFQVFSNIEAGDHTGFYELTYVQTLGDFTILAGQHDLNTEFVTTSSTDLFLNSSFGIMPTVSLNTPASIFPLAAPCLALRWEPDGLWTYRAAVYDGNPGDMETNRYNMQWKMSREEGVMAIAEAEMDRTHGGIGKGTLKIGGFYHTGSFEDMADTNLTWTSNYGAYLTLHRIMKPSDGYHDEGINGFIQFGVAPRDRNVAAFYAAAGIRSFSPIPTRTHDLIGLSVAHLGTGNRWQSLSGDNQKGETSLELTYLLQINDIYSIQPDLQFILNPGANAQVKDALVGIIRFAIAF
jgi:porin